jgi:hypothetical protein
MTKGFWMAWNSVTGAHEALEMRCHNLFCYNALASNRKRDPLGSKPN